MEHDEQPTLGDATFLRDTTGLPEARLSEFVPLADGDSHELRIAPVRKRVGEREVRMLAYNGSIPGPTLRVQQGSEVQIDVVNDGDLEATVHWHGLRLDNRYDGTHETQAAVPVGGSFSYRIAFADPGVYWYHPHIREDYGQELGLYGNIVVVPAEEGYWPPVDRELVLTLDDILIDEGGVAPFSRVDTNYAAMGRYGNVLLVGGQTDLALGARQDEVVRFYLTNTANSRVFNVALPGARMKLVGGDSGRCEREEIADSVILAPSERAVVDVLFDQPGRLALEHRTPGRTYVLADIDVAAPPRRPSLRAQFEELRVNAEWVAEREWIAPYVNAEPDKELAFVAEMEMEASEGAAVFACPMHPEVVSSTADHCPKCGMKLLPADLVASSGQSEHGHDEAPRAHHGHGSDTNNAGGIEWEDEMVEVNRLTTRANTRWQLVDRPSGAVNHEIDWTFRVGDRVKIRLVNEMDSDHPMHHPFHVHGAGRFVVLARDGVPEANLVWKDTVLLRAGETADILLDVTNAGRWMAHCHIAEHHENGMMFSFQVTPAG